jgi:hypothetical protein
MAELRPAVVSFLAAVVYRHCEKHGITDIEAREHVAVSALRFYERGCDSEEKLLEMLAWEDDPARFLAAREKSRTEGGGFSAM